LRIALWVARRLAMVALQLAAVSIVIFGVLILIPGKPEEILLGPNPSSPSALGAIRSKYHLDEPLPAQYWYWLTHAVHFDFGRSIQTNETVTSLIGQRVPVTFLLAAYAITLVILVAVPMGLAAGVKEGTIVDRSITVITTAGISAPAFAVGMAAMYVFGVLLAWFPVYGFGTGFGGRLWHLTLPASALALTVIAYIARQTRASAAAVNEQDFMTFARARGIALRHIWIRYLLRNSSLPVATSIGLVLIYFLTGTIIIEHTFALQGIGTLVLTSISTKDVPVVQGVGILVALLVLGANLVADLCYAGLDPRLRRRMF
jgi:peptide/nickel transport system permease protein